MGWDTDQIRSMVDCREIVEKDLGAPKHRGATYNVYRCPLHHETKGYSLAVYNDHWTCFGKCGTGGDAIKWLTSYHTYSFNEACEILGGHLTNTVARPRIEHQPEPERESEPPSAEWQEYANCTVDIAEQILWSKDGEKALNYLKETRGLTNSTIRMARLGYVPSTHIKDYTFGRVMWPDWMLDEKPVRVHCGITIPHFAEGALWAVRVRRPPGVEGSKYMGIRGGSKVLYNISEVLPRCPVVITEGEFDALALEYSASYNGSMAQVIALCSASNKHINGRWLPYLVSAPVILARLDDDNAGSRAVDVLKSLSNRVRSIQVPPPHKDINDFYVTRGYQAIRAWIEECLSCQ